MTTLYCIGCLYDGKKMPRPLRMHDTGPEFAAMAVTVAEGQALCREHARAVVQIMKKKGKK